MEPRRIVSLTAAQQEIREAILKICARFGDDYWLARDTDGAFPHEFHQALAQAGWLGIAMPEAYGGAGLGITEAAVMMQAIAESGAAFSGASAVHMNIFGLNPVVVFGTEEQKRRFLPPLIAGKEKACFAVTEPNTGLDTTRAQDQAPCGRATATPCTGRRSGSRRRRWPTACCCWRAPRRSRRSRSAPRACRCSTPRWTATTSRRVSSTRWAARPWTPTSCSSMACRCRWRTASARKARASSTSCTA